MKVKPYLLFAVILIVNLAYADEDISSPPVDSVTAAVRRDMEALRNDEANQDVGRVVEKYGYAVVAAAEEFTNDENETVRRSAYLYINVATSHSTNLAERQEGVGKLLKAAYTDNKRDDVSLDWLLKYRSQDRSQDFSPATVKILGEKFAEKPDYYTILLIGVAGDTSQLERLAEIRDKVKEPLQLWNCPKKSHKLAFAALLARARMGEKDDIKRCIELVNSYPDENLKLILCKNKLSYVRQPEVVEYLKGYLLDNRYESGGEVNLTYGERAMLALEEMIEDFPSKDKSLKFDSVTKRTQYCYEWLNKQEKLNIIR